MFTVPPAPRRGRKNSRGGRKQTFPSLSHVILILGTLFVLYTFIILGVKFMELLEYCPHNLTDGNQETGFIMEENSPNVSGEFPLQFDMPDFIQFLKESRPVVPSDVGQDEETFEAPVNANKWKRNVKFGVAAEDRTASPKTYGSAGDANNVPQPELPGKGDPPSFLGASATGRLVDFKNDFLSASAPVSGEDGSPAGANSKSSHSNNNGGISGPTKEASVNSQVTPHRAKRTASASFASRGLAFLAAAAEEARFPKRRGVIFWKVRVD